MSMVSCTEDYTDWGNPQSNPKEEAVSFGNGSVTPVDVINLADVKTEKVKVASIVAPLLPTLLIHLIIRLTSTVSHSTLMLMATWQQLN